MWERKRKNHFSRISSSKVPAKFLSRNGAPVKLFRPITGGLFCSRKSAQPAALSVIIMTYLILVSKAIMNTKIL